MSDFFEHFETESLNSFLTCQPFSKISDMNVPLIVAQLSIFTCGGIALGWCLSHKVSDAGTASSFITTWTSFCRGGDIKEPDFEEASMFFPWSTSIPQNHISIMERLWFVKDKYLTRRFVFDAKAIAALKAKAKGKLEPTRIQTLSCFIWKCTMAVSKAISGTPNPSILVETDASKAISDTPKPSILVETAASKAISDTLKPSILVEAVNLRPNTKPPMNDNSTGNLFWWALAIASPIDTNSVELNYLTSMLSEAIADCKSEAHTLQGENGRETMSEFCEQLEEMFSLENPDIFAFTSWSRMVEFTRPNFGWGEPTWVGLMGKPGPEFRNLIVFIDTEDGKGIEAWITLDEGRMSILQTDPEFLKFASLNPRIDI